MRDGGKVVDISTESGWLGTFRLSQEGDGGRNDDLAEEFTKELLTNEDGDAVSSAGFTNWWRATGERSRPSVAGAECFLLSGGGIRMGVGEDSSGNEDMEAGGEESLSMSPAVKDRK